MTSHSASSTITAPNKSWLFWLAGIVLFFVFISLIQGILLPFVVGILTAYFLNPAAKKLEHAHWSRTAAAAIITFSFFVIIITLGVVLIPLITHQLSALLHELPDYTHQIQTHYSYEAQKAIARLSPEQVSNIEDAVSNIGSEAVHWAGTVAARALQSGLALINLLMLFFITPVVAFYLLRDWNTFVAHIDHLLPLKHAAVIHEQLDAIDHTLSGFIRGQTNVCLIMATYYATALSLAGAKFGLVIGLLTGMMLFMPFVGFATGFTLSTIVAVFQFDDPVRIGIVLAIYGVGEILESSIITPKLVGSKVGLHPLWIIFGMLTGATLFGFVGVLISVPLTAVTGVLVRFAITRYLSSSLYTG